jgi:hypothetical protein
MRRLLWFALAALTVGCSAPMVLAPDPTWCAGAYDAARGTNFVACQFVERTEIQAPGDVAPTE